MMTSPSIRAPGRNVYNPSKADRIVGIHNHRKVRREVLDLLTLKKTIAADQYELQPFVHEHLLDVLAGEDAVLSRHEQTQHGKKRGKGHRSH